MSAYYGCFDTSIKEVASQLWDKLPTFNCALVRGLDSIRDPRQISTICESAHLGAIAIDNAGVVIGREELLVACERDDFFVGFDEILLSIDNFDKFVTDIPALTTDGGQLDDGDVRKLSHLLHNTRITLAMGDGCGTNCVTPCSSFWEAMNSRWVRL